MNTSTLKYGLRAKLFGAAVVSGLAFGLGAAPALAVSPLAPVVQTGDENTVTPPPVSNGDHTKACSVHWVAETVNNAAYEDYSNNGYVQKVKKAVFKDNWGRFEAEHWLTDSKLFWRVPLAVDHTVSDAKVRIVFTDPQWKPERATFANFPEAAAGAEDWFTRFTEERNEDGSPRYQRAAQENTLTPQWTTDAQGHDVLTLELGELKADTWVMFQFQGLPTTQGEQPLKAHKDYRLTVDFTGLLAPGVLNCPGKVDPTPEPTSTPTVEPTPSATATPPAMTPEPTAPAEGEAPHAGLPDTGGSTEAFSLMGGAAMVALGLAGVLTAVNRGRERRQQ